MTIDISGEAIDSVVESGLAHQWADVLEYRAGQYLRLSRWDTDGAELTIRAKDVRRAIRRVARESPGDLGLTDVGANMIRNAVSGADVLDPCSADDLIQIAAMGRAQY